jgi:neutral ceramidase
VDSSRDNIRVHRPDRVLEYAPYDEDLEPDEILYDEEGKIVTPIDEFNALYGGAFCGEDIPLIPGVSIGTETWPYSSCIDVFTISYVIINFFDMTEADLELPLPESTRIGVGASRIGPVSIREPDGSVVQDDLFMAFLPGEPTAMFTEQLRRRAADELGYAHTLPIGYAQDHMGYLLIPEDWLLGGYEPNINVWGPLQAEHLMEQVLAIGQGWLSTDLREPINPDGAYDPTEYITEWSLPEAPPDSTPGAGLLVEAVPEDFYQPLEGLEVQVAPPASVERVRGSVQLMWEGGDPGVDLPMVTLERQAEDGSWAEVQTAAGRAVTDAEHDMLLLHFPDPLYPFEEAQSHTWWVVWQAVGHVADRAGLPEGTYRLHVTGQHYAGGATTWPWPTTAYEITSEPFLVEPAELTLSWDGSSLRASLDAPAWGYRLVHLEGSSTGSNPLVEPTLTWRMADGSELPAAESPTTSGGASVWTPSVPEGAVSAVVTDQYGNEGQISL